MIDLTANPHPMKTAPGGWKTASGPCESNPDKNAYRLNSEALKLWEKNRPAATTTASGVSVYGFRYYDPEEGRWLGRDPIGERGGVNIYGFVGNDGVGVVDILGMESWDNLKNVITQANAPIDVWNHYAKQKNAGAMAGVASSDPYLLTCHCGVIDLMHFMAGVAATHGGETPEDFLKRRYDDEFASKIKTPAQKAGDAISDIRKLTLGLPINKAATADDHPSEALGALAGTNQNWKESLITILAKCKPVEDDKIINRFVSDHGELGKFAMNLNGGTWRWSIPYIVADKINSSASKIGKSCCPEFKKDPSRDLRSQFLEYFRTHTGLDWRSHGYEHFGPVPPGNIVNQ